MSNLASRVTDEQVAAAQLRIVLDEKLGRQTPDVVRQIASIKKVKPASGEPDMKSNNPTPVADGEPSAVDPGRRVRDPDRISLDLLHLRTLSSRISDYDGRQLLVRQLHNVAIELWRDHPHASDLLAELKHTEQTILDHTQSDAVSQPADVELSDVFGVGTPPEYGGPSSRERTDQEIDIENDYER